MEGSPFVYRPWGELYEAVVSGKPAFDRLYGISLFDHLAEHSEDAAIFNAAMTSGARLALSAILAAYDFSRFERIVDVGGGHGELLHGILSANRRLRGVLADLPSVVAGAAILRTGIVAADRFEVMGIDFFRGASRKRSRLSDESNPP